MPRSVNACESAHRLAHHGSMFDIGHAAEARTLTCSMLILCFRKIPIYHHLKAINVASIYPIGVAVFRDLRFQCLYLLF